MKDANEINLTHGDTPRYVEKVIAPQGSPRVPNKTHEAEIGDAVLLNGKRYRILESNKLDAQHRKIPHIVLMGPGEV